MGVWLYEHEFKNFQDAFWRCGVSTKGAECNCSIYAKVRDGLTALIALEQNPHLAQWFAFEATTEDIVMIENFIKSNLVVLGYYKAGYVRPCGCLELLDLE